jgi:hypothetical protein
MTNEMRDGYNAGYMGEGLCNNPYKGAESKAWEKGYKKACAERGVKATVEAE